jgi:hypothetical protein
LRSTRRDACGLLLLMCVRVDRASKLRRVRKRRGRERERERERKHREWIPAFLQAVFCTQPGRKEGEEGEDETSAVDNRRQQQQQQNETGGRENATWREETNSFYQAREASARTHTHTQQSFAHTRNTFSQRARGKARRSWLCPSTADRHTQKPPETQGRGTGGVGDLSAPSSTVKTTIECLFFFFFSF